MIQTFKFRPKGTLWLGCEFEIDFDCGKPPQFAFADARLRLTRAPAIGFLLSHEYVVSGAHIVAVEHIPTEKAGCRAAERYRFLLRIRISDKIGVGFNLGSGTGTFGWTLDSEPSTHRFVTDIICCDGEPRTDVAVIAPTAVPDAMPATSDRRTPVVAAEPADRLGALGVMFGAAALPLTYAQSGTPVAQQNLLIAGGVALGLSVAVTALRLVWSFVNRRRAEPAAPS